MSTSSGHAGGVSRDEFMLGIAASLGSQSTSVPAPPKLPVSLIRRVRSSGDLVDRFRVEARKAGMTVDRTDRQSAVETTANAIAGHRGENVLLACAEKSIQSMAEKAAKQAGTETPDTKMLSRDGVFKVRASITDVHAAVAETGSLVMTSHPPRARLAHLAPELHVAIVLADQIVPDLYDLFADESLAATIRNAAYAALVTGPSKTADIEGVLITGVHGPGAVHVIVIE